MYYTTNTVVNMTPSEAFALLGTYIVFIIPLIVLSIIAQWKILTKAGHGGWKILIPFYGQHVWANVSWKASIFWCAAIIPSAIITLGILFSSQPIVLIGYIVGLVLALVWVIGSSIHLARRFNKGKGFACGLIFLGIIFQMILAFSSATYDASNDY